MIPFEYICHAHCIRIRIHTDIRIIRLIGNKGALFQKHFLHPGIELRIIRRFIKCQVPIHTAAQEYDIRSAMLAQMRHIRNTIGTSSVNKMNVLRWNRNF